MTSIIGNRSLYKARKWTILVSIHNNLWIDLLETIDYRSFLDFCRAIKHSRLQKLEILILSVVWSNEPIEDLRDLRRYFRPLGLLLPGFDRIIRVAGLPDFPGFPGLTEDTIIEQ